MSITNTALFVCLDDFAKTYEDWERHRLIPSGRQRLRAGKLTLGESLFIMVLFHLSPFKDFKHYWIVTPKHPPRLSVIVSFMVSRICHFARVFFLSCLNSVAPG